MVRAFPLRVHSNAKISIKDFDDKLELELRNTLTNESTKRKYLKLDSGIDINEAVKIDTIIYHMHHDIGLNVWDDDNKNINRISKDEVCILKGGI